MMNPNTSMNQSAITFLNDSPTISKQPALMNKFKSFIAKKITANSEVTKAKLEAAKKRRLELTQTKDMDRDQLSKINMNEKVDAKIK